MYHIITLVWVVYMTSSCTEAAFSANSAVLGEKYLWKGQEYDMPTTKKRRVCFFTDWSNTTARREKGVNFWAKSIDPFLCTHINYCFMSVSDTDHKLVLRKEKVKTEEILKNLAKLKEQNKKLKIILSVGGDSHDKKLPRFHEMAKNKKNREAFIESVVKFMEKHKLDGFSLDWEYPTFKPRDIQKTGALKVDRKNFIKLLKELRKEFGSDKYKQHKWTLSASVAAGKKKIENAYDIPEMAKLVDWVNVMAYALWVQSNGARVTGHYTAMKYAGPNSYMKERIWLTVPAAIQFWINAKMPRSKINLGTATYGRSFKLAEPNMNGLGNNITGKGDPGPRRQKAGVYAYYETCEEKDWDQEVEYDKSAVMAPFASKDDLWLAYESPASLAYKVRNIVNEFGEGAGVGGISFWTLDLDDFNNICKEGHFPLIREAVMEMV